MELLLGCGRKREKVVTIDGENWTQLVTLDFNPDHKPDVVHDLEVLPYPFGNDTFDEIHAPEVLEHTGTQGDFRFFFAQFSELWRILKPNGLLAGTVPLPESRWAWADPSHKRVIAAETFVFLSQAEYARQVGHTAMSDFRFIYKADFEPVGFEEADGLLYFALRAVKPSRLEV